MERMRACARPRPACAVARGLQRYIRAADEAGDDGGNGAGMSIGAPSLPSDPHTAQVVALQSGIALLGLDKRLHRVPSGQTHFFRYCCCCCLRGIWPALASRVRLVSAKSEKSMQRSGACTPVGWAS